VSEASPDPSPGQPPSGRVTLSVGSASLERVQLKDPYIVTICRDAEQSNGQPTAQKLLRILTCQGGKPWIVAVRRAGSQSLCVPELHKPAFTALFAAQRQ
jgi:hypothetical protein